MTARHATSRTQAGTYKSGASSERSTLRSSFGLRRHGTHRAGSDGTIADKLVEVKTISPEKASDLVLVKSQGNFEQLLIIRIDRNFQFQGKLLDRSELKGVAGKFLKGRFKDDASND